MKIKATKEELKECLRNAIVRILAEDMKKDKKNVEE